MDIQPYQRKVQYYETDQMGIVHHANYLRWFEEARLHWLEQIGLPFEAVEAAGIFVPVIGAELRYRQSLRFGESVRIRLAITRLTGTKMNVSYELHSSEDGTLCTTGETRHGFVNRDGRPVSLKRAKPEFYDRLLPHVR